MSHARVLPVLATDRRSLPSPLSPAATARVYGNLRPANPGLEGQPARLSPVNAERRLDASAWRLYAARCVDFGRHDNGQCEKRLLTLGLALALAGGASDSGGAPISFAAHQRIVY